jgi:vancomycin resistance protein VanJ
MNNTWHLLKILLAVGLWLFALGVNGNLVFRWWPGDRLMSVRLLNYLMPWMLAALVPGFIFAVLTYRKWLAVGLAVPAVIICFHYAPLFITRDEAVVPANGSLKVMSYNIWSENSNMARAAALILREKPDILLLQEVKPRQYHKLKLEIRKLYAELEIEPNFSYSPDLLQAVMSPYPLVFLDKFKRKAQVQIVRVDMPHGPITIFNVHPLRGNWLRRHNELAALLKENILTVDGPVILGGDFNTTDQTGTYRLLSRHLRNAHWETGRGFGFTFPAPGSLGIGVISIPPLVRIDHLFFNQYFSITSAYTLRESGGSDHLPIVAEFVFVSPEAPEE